MVLKLPVEKIARVEDSEWLLCPDCESHYRDRVLQPGEALQCRMCGARVKRYGASNLLQAVWAVATAGLVCAVLANIDSILTFGILGNTQSNRIITGVSGLMTQGYSPVAAMVFGGAIAGPVFHMLSVWYVSAACCLGRRLPFVPAAFRLTKWLEPWNLIPIYAVAILVAVVKLDMLGDIEWKRGTLWIVLMSLCYFLIVQMFDHRVVKERLEELK